MKYRYYLIFVVSVILGIGYNPLILKAERKKFVYPHISSAGFVSRTHISELGVIIRSYEDKILISQGDKVLISFKRPVKVGEKLYVYRESEPIKNPLTGKLIGYRIEILGEVEIKVKGEKKASGIIKTSFAPISPGDKIQTFKFPGDEVILKRCKRPLKGMIIAVNRSISRFARYNIVYIDKGEADGVERGNLFVVYEEKAKGIEEEKGRLLILATQKDTSTALVIESKKPMKIGDLIRGEI